MCLSIHSSDVHFPTILASALFSCLQSSAPQATTTTLASIAVSAALWAPTSQTSVRTSAPAAQEIQALTLMARPVWPSARVRGWPGCGEWREISEPCAWEKGVRGGKAGGSRAGVGGWAAKSPPGQLSGMPVASFQILEGQKEGGPSTPEEQMVT